MSAREIDGWRRAVPMAERQRADVFLDRWAAAQRFPGIVSGTGVSLMGVVNLTCDSFYALSRRATAAAGVRAGMAAFAAGAAIVDVGAQSTRPGSLPVAEAQELGRALPVVHALARQGRLVSIDTLRPSVAQAAVAAGAQIVNDVSGLLRPSDLPADAAVVIGDMRGHPATMQRWLRTQHGVLDVYRRLAARLAAFRTAGIVDARLAVDPGFGFGKAVHHNQALIARLPLFLGLGVAVAVGVSRKASLGFVSGTPGAMDRLPASLAAALAAARSGASVLRVHDVAATRQALQVARFFG